MTRQGRARLRAIVDSRAYFVRHFHKVYLPSFMPTALARMIDADPYFDGVLKLSNLTETTLEMIVLHDPRPQATALEPRLKCRRFEVRHGRFVSLQVPA